MKKLPFAFFRKIGENPNKERYSISVDNKKYNCYITGRVIFLGITIYTKIEFINE